MLRCEISLAHERLITYIVHRSNAVPDRAVCFLGRFLPKLGGAAKRRLFFFARRAVPIQRRFDLDHATSAAPPTRKAMARATGIVNAGKVPMTASEVDGQGRTATVDGSINQNGWFTVNINGANVDCKNINMPFVVPATGS